MSPPRNLSQLRRGSMKHSEIFLPMRVLQLLAVRIKNFVQQQVASIASLHHFIGGRSVARKHNLPIMSLERVSISFLPNPMLDRKGGDRNIVVAIHHSWLNLMHIDFVSCSVSLLQSAPPNAHILHPSLLDVRSHILQPMRTISLERLRPSQHPRRKNQIRIAQRVVGMQVSYKNNLQFLSLKSPNSIPPPRAPPPHHPRTAVDQICPIIYHHRDRRPPPVRVRTRISRSEHHHASRRAMILSESRRTCSHHHRQGPSQEKDREEKKFRHPTHAPTPVMNFRTPEFRQSSIQRTL